MIPTCHYKKFLHPRTNKKFSRKYLFLNPFLRTCLLMLERERGRETLMWERNIDWLPSIYALTGNQTCNLLVCAHRMMLPPAEPPGENSRKDLLKNVLSDQNVSLITFWFILKLLTTKTVSKLLIVRITGKKKSFLCILTIVIPELSR